MIDVFVGAGEADDHVKLVELNKANGTLGDIVALKRVLVDVPGESVLAMLFLGTTEAEEVEHAAETAMLGSLSLLLASLLHLELPATFLLVSRQRCLHDHLVLALLVTLLSLQLEQSDAVNVVGHAILLIHLILLMRVQFGAQPIPLHNFTLYIASLVLAFDHFEVVT